MIAEQQIKDSGINWIGEIPKHWKIKKFKYFINKIADGATPSRKDDDNFKGPISWIVVSDIKDRIKSTKETLSQKGFDSSSTKLWQPGDIVISLGATIGNVGILDIQASTKQGICGVNVGNMSYNSYVFYLLKSNSNLLKNWAVGTTILEFRASRLREVYFQFPPLDEQKRIADYLDKKTQQIDELIEKSKKKIELLKEQRTALIYHCVTKGLNPDAEIKDSGIDWIGGIPKHWKIKKFKYFINKIADGATPSRKDDDNFKGPISWIVVSDIKDRIKSTKETLSQKGFDSSSTKLWQPGDIVISLGATIGNVGILDIQASTKQGICGVNVGNMSYNSYVFYLLKSNSNLLKNWAVGTTILEFRASRLREVYFQFPPLGEQKQIADYLDQKTQQIDTVVEKEEKRIYLLKEYRQSMISSAVTGKINITEAMV